MTANGKSLGLADRYRESSWPSPVGRVLQLAVTIERPQSRQKNQVAGLRSPVGKSFVPILEGGGSVDQLSRAIPAQGCKRAAEALHTGHLRMKVQRIVDGRAVFGASGWRQLPWPFIELLFSDGLQSCKTDLKILSDRVVQVYKQRHGFQHQVVFVI
jgi:hypothetical protein